MLGSDRPAQLGLAAICSATALNALVARTAFECQLLIRIPWTRMRIQPRPEKFYER